MHTCNNAAIRTIALGFVATLLSYAGCGDEGASVPQDSFRAVVETVIESDEIFVQRIRLIAHGRRTVVVLEGADRDTATIEPDPETGLMVADVILFADLIEQPGGQAVLRTLVRIQTGRGVTVGGPATGPVPAGRTVAEFLASHLASGIYPLAEDVELATLRDNLIILRIE